MRLFGNVDGQIDRLDRPAFFGGIFDGQHTDTPIAVPIRFVQCVDRTDGYAIGGEAAGVTLAVHVIQGAFGVGAIEADATPVLPQATEGFAVGAIAVQAGC